MAIIVIKDLPESMELDRQAMLAIAGGSRFRAGGARISRPAVRRIRLFDLSPGASARPAATRPPTR
ncbi:hypothetical protein [Massilia niastensis]|uniref:hypothetical protein n=1 Tax=Massilia niastensis TaxID=544911 RepID=UPI000382D075|nr:hypothetical protein [Massilia niastensis]